MPQREQETKALERGTTPLPQEMNLIALCEGTAYSGEVGH
jgi:hypothetical protein